MSPAAQAAPAGPFLEFAIGYESDERCNVIIRGFITRLAVTLGLWALLTGACFLYMYLHSSASYLGIWAYGGFTLLFFGWYVFIPVLMAVVSIVWFIAQRIARMRNSNLSQP